LESGAQALPVIYISLPTNNLAANGGVIHYHYEPMNVDELREAADSWLDKYHFYRPHEVLEFLTPGVFSHSGAIRSRCRDVLEAVSTDTVIDKG
jgi:hypothetical protein